MELITINGTIGVGKTSLAKALSRQLGYKIFEEEIEKNFQLSHLRKTIKGEVNKLKSSLIVSQSYILESQKINLFKALESIRGSKGVIFISHPIALYYIYISAYHDLNIIGDSYLKLFREVVFEDFDYPNPSIVINLYADVDTIFNRIKERDREGKRELNQKDFIESSLYYFTKFGFVDVKMNPNFNNSLIINQDTSNLDIDQTLEQVLQTIDAQKVDES